MPKDASYEGCLTYIRSLPIIPQPEVYGLHENADITKDNQETLMVITKKYIFFYYSFLFQFLHGVLSTQTQISFGGGDDDALGTVIDLAKDILAKVPDLFDVHAVSKAYPVMYKNSMNTVLRQVSNFFLNTFSCLGITTFIYPMYHEL